MITTPWVFTKPMTISQRKVMRELLIANQIQIVLEVSRSISRLLIEMTNDKTEISTKYSSEQKN